jgi:hypothetical protein
MALSAEASAYAAPLTHAQPELGQEEYLALRKTLEARGE